MYLQGLCERDSSSKYREDSLRVLETATQPVQLLRHANGAWSCGALPGHLDSASTLVLACGTGALRTDSGAVHELRGAFRSAALIGCSTSWLGDLSDSEQITALVWKLSRTRLSLASAPLRNASDSFRAGQLLGQQLMTPSLQAVLVLADGGRTNGSQFLRGFHNVVGDGMHLFGGLSSPLPLNNQHWVLRSGVPTDGFVSAVGFYGSALRIEQRSINGWNAAGPARRITRSRDCTVFELDGKPAWEVFRTYLAEGATSDVARTLPLAIHVGDHVTVRTVRHVDESTGAMTFAADMPETAMAQVVFGPKVKDAATALDAETVQLTCVGACRLAWTGGSPSGDTGEVAHRSMTLALDGEFTRRTTGPSDMQGGSITTTQLRETVR